MRRVLQHSEYVNQQDKVDIIIFTLRHSLAKGSDTSRIKSMKEIKIIRIDLPIIAHLYANLVLPPFVSTF